MTTNEIRYQYLRSIAKWEGATVTLHFEKDTIDMPFGQTPESFDLAVDRAMASAKVKLTETSEVVP